jgi:hypothetical protein
LIAINRAESAEMKEDIRPTCDLCNMYFDVNIFWDWHKLEGHMVMCRNGAGKR